MDSRINDSFAKGVVQHLNPEGLNNNPAFSQMVILTGPAKTIYIGMQNAVDGNRNIIGKGDIAAQTEQVLKNIQICLDAAGARREHIIQWNIYLTQGQPIAPAFAVGQQWWGNLPNPPLNSVFFVAGFSPPDFLIGIDAIAVVP